MTRFVTGVLGAVVAGLLLAGTAAQAQTAGSGAEGARKPAAAVTEASSQNRKLRRVPIYRPEWEPNVYPRYNPGPNAVRDCTATYVQEHRPSGTVITPRMNCYWRPG